MATAKQIINIAAAELGVKEIPSGSNNVKYNTEFYGRPVSGSAYPWCCAFVWWVFRQAGAPELFAGGGKTAWCPYAAAWYEKQGEYYTNPRDFKPGDIIFFNFQGAAMPGHIGIVESVNPDGSVNCLEGNTSVKSQDNGGSVMRRKRSGSVILGAGRPKYEEDTDMGIDISKLTDEQIDALWARIQSRLASKAPAGYAVDSCRKAVKSGLFKDGNGDELLDSPCGVVMRQDMAVVLDRKHLLD